MEFQRSKTYANLMKAYEGELKASAKYHIYGKQAKKEGFEQISNIFQETSGNESEHAEIWLEFLDGNNERDTYHNLKDAASGEKHEWTSMYRGFAETAEKEGYSEIARLFRGVADIERHHDYRFEQLAENIRRDEVFCKRTEVVWICLNCGNIYHGKCAPENCPVCGYPRGYYELNCENY